MQDYEKLGAFYLGRKHNQKEALVHYDSKDLLTHAVCVGMTGSGKTGLCIGLLEEAAIDGIPAIVIDPKGDLSNLLLTFPELQPADFRPWINEDDARAKGVSPDEFAAAQAQQWRDGLTKSGQDGARIQRLRDSAAFSIYTPGSTAGCPISVLSSFTAPPAALLADQELLHDRISATVTSGARRDGMVSRSGITQYQRRRRRSGGGAKRGGPRSRSFTSASPATKPPTWAKKATPPVAAAPRDATPLKSCMTNQSPSHTTAGIGTMAKKIQVYTEARG